MAKQQNDEPSRDAAPERDEQPGSRKLAQNLIDLGILGDAPEPAHVSRLQTIAEKMPEQVARKILERSEQELSAAGKFLTEFAAQFSISPAELALLSSMIEGKTIVTHAEEHDVSINTARTQMRGLIQKTGATGQLDLIRQYYDFKHQKSADQF